MEDRSQVLYNGVARLSHYPIRFMMLSPDAFVLCRRDNRMHDTRMWRVFELPVGHLVLD
jgi:hypothetical protein